MLSQLSYVSNLRFSFSDHNTHTHSNSDLNTEEDIQVRIPKLLRSFLNLDQSFHYSHDRK